MPSMVLPARTHKPAPSTTSNRPMSGRSRSSSTPVVSTHVPAQMASNVCQTPITKHEAVPLGDVVRVRDVVAREGQRVGDIHLATVLPGVC